MAGLNVAGTSALAQISGPSADAVPPPQEVVLGDARPLTTIKAAQGERLSLPVRNVAHLSGKLGSVYIVGLPFGTIVSDIVHNATVSSEARTVDISSWNLENISITLPTLAPSSLSSPIVASVVAVLPKSERSASLRTETLSTTVIVPELRAARPTEAVKAPPAERAAPPPAAAPAAAPTPRADESAARTWASPEPATRSIAPMRHAAPAPAAAVVAPSAPPAAPKEMPEPKAVQATLQATPQAAPQATSQAAPQATPQATPARDAGPPSADPSAKALVARARQAITLGNISGARLFLQRAAAREDPEALRLLAQTYDPAVLRTWKVHGLQPDPERARHYYDAADRASGKAAPALATTVREISAR
ncbi:hypothetical protein [Methylobacterium oryzisoli]|uniref:hypothetical protein n=1 Tax=Methylobacterium oryzisoli TaxID=3385502 RepID=UPI00389153E9